ncbi:MAG: hypothetical protein ACI892_002472, partial [Marinobacter maritimus]
TMRVVECIPIFECLGLSVYSFSEIAANPESLLKHQKPLWLVLPICLLHKKTT